MKISFTLNKTLHSHLWSMQPHPFLTHFVLVCSSALLISIASMINIPISSVPITLQTFAILLVAMAIGPSMGAYATLLYLLAGAVGYNVFPGGEHGFKIIFGSPMTGFMWGSVIMALLSGYYMKNGWALSKITAMFAALIPLVIYQVIGFIYLLLFLSPSSAIYIRFIPYISVDLLTIFILGMVMPYVWYEP